MRVRIYEKILIISFSIVFGLQLLPYFPGRSFLFVATSWLFALFYFVGGYWLFNRTDVKSYFLPIVSGFAFATSVCILPFLIWLNQDKLYDILPALNGILCLGLIVYLIIYRKNIRNSETIKSILKRSVIIFAVTAFFAYTPTSLKPYRRILIAVNNGNEHLLSNLYMFEYGEIYKDALKEGDCSRAIEFAEKANKSGLDWIGVKENELQSVDTTLQNYLSYYISATFSNLYEAYRCKANREYENNNFEGALEDYKKAHKNLILSDPDTEYWKVEESWSFNNMAFCYKNLKQYVIADSLYVLAIEHYKAATNTDQKGLATLHRNLALSLAETSDFHYSNAYYKTANSILQKDSIANRKELQLNYIDLGKNYLQQDSLSTALFFLNRAVKLSKQGEPQTCLASLYYGFCLYRLNAFHKSDSVLKSCLECYKSQPKDNEPNIAETYLALTHVNIALARYDDAKKHITTGIDIIKRNFGTNSLRYAGYLRVSAYLHKVIGNYKISHEQYNQAIGIYTKESTSHRMLPDALSGLAELELTLSEFSSAKQHSDNSILIATKQAPLTYLNATSLLNSAAYVRYYMALYQPADTLYRKVLSINDNYGLHSNPETAIAMNGLGLIEMEKRKFTKADSLFAQSLTLHKQIFTDNHPLTATVYLNLGILCIRDGRLSDGEENINKALLINRHFFENNHDVFADISVAYGDLAQKRGEKKLANEHYQKALEIYNNKFSDSHNKIVMTEQKLKS